MSRKLVVLALIWLATFVARPAVAQEKWFGAVSADDCVKYKYLSVAFADESLRSPASMFGHTFLVFHNQLKPELDAMTLEFVGDTSSAENPVARALFLSIEGRFLVRRLAYKLLEYGREGRDVRVWRIGTVPAGCRRTLEAEIREVHEYTFLRKNCSWHAARVASKLTGAGRGGSEDGMTLGVPVTIPVKTLDQFVGPGIREDATYVASRRRAAGAIGDLSVAQRDAARRVFDGYGGAPGDFGLRGARAIGAVAGVRLNDEGAAESRRDIFQIKKKFLAAVDGRGIGEDSDAGATQVRRRLAAVGVSVLGGRPDIRVTGQLGMRNVKMAALGINDSGELQVLDFSVRSIGSVGGGLGIERLGVVRLDAAVPDSMVTPGFTRLVDIAYESYRDAGGEELQREAGLRFGAGGALVVGGANMSVMVVGSARYFDVPERDSWGSGGDVDGFSARWSARLRAYHPVTSRTRIKLVAERYWRDRFPVMGVVDFVFVSDLDQETSAHLGFHGVGVGSRRVIQGNWELGITKSI